MGPLLFRAEDVVNVPLLGPKLGASMGPLLFRAEDARERATATGPEWASMGPLLFRAEDARPVGHQAVARPLQWGRSCSERKTRRRGTARGNTNGFNGAALVQSGRHETVAANAYLPTLALQWGRSCSERKTSAPCAVNSNPGPLQWGRSCSERKTSVFAMPIVGE